MANDINVGTLSGRLTRDPEIRQVGEQKVAKFVLASNYYQGKNKEEGTTFLDCEAWSPKAEILEKYCKKGSPLTVIYELRQDNWEKNGEKRSKLFAKVNDFKMESKTGGEVKNKKENKKDNKSEVEVANKENNDEPEVPF